MAGTTRIVGVALIAVGVIGYLATDRASATALLPAVLGLVLFVLGVLARRSESASKHLMHTAMVIALLGIAGAAPRLGGLGDGDAAAIASAATIGICVIFLVLGIRSFITARKNR